MVQLKEEQKVLDRFTWNMKQGLSSCVKSDDTAVQWGDPVTRAGGPFRCSNRPCKLSRSDVQYMDNNIKWAMGRKLGFF